MQCEPNRSTRGFLTRCFASIVLTAAIALGVWLLPAPACAQIDAGIDQTVWKMLYGVTDAQVNSAAWLAADDDGDGLSNGAELAAGTNPFDRTSGLHGQRPPLNRRRHHLSADFPDRGPGKLYTSNPATDISPDFHQAGQTLTVAS